MEEEEEKERERLYPTRNEVDAVPEVDTDLAYFKARRFRNAHHVDYRSSSSRSLCSNCGSTPRASMTRSTSTISDDSDADHNMHVGRFKSEEEEVKCPS